MNPATEQTTMRIYASENEQYKSEPTEDQTKAGVVPLDSLPAAWWNWLWNKVTSNNNAILQSVADLRTEIGNVLTNAGITANALVTNQLAQAIISIHQRKPFFDDQNQPVPGSVISSAARNSVSVDAQTGQMTVNALSDWANQSSVKTVIENLVNGGTSTIADLEQGISDLNQKTGTLTNLTTDAKTNLVAAINEVDSHADSNATSISAEVTARQNADSSLSQAISAEETARKNADGTLTNLTTDAKTNLVAAINEVDSHADSNASAIGTLANLATTDKSNLVTAINEVNSKVSSVQYSTSEFDTNKKWTNSKTIYGRVLSNLLVRFSQNTSFPTNREPIAFIIFNNTLYVGTSGQGIYTSIDGEIFTQNTSFPTTYIVRAFYVFNNTLYVGTNGKGLYTSTDGSTFTQNTSLSATSTIFAFITFKNTLYVGTMGDHGLYTSTDGSTFTQNTSFSTNYSAVAFIVFKNTLYVGAGSYGLYTSTDGSTFTQNTSFPTTYIVRAFYVFNNTLYVGTNGKGLYTSTDGSTFTQNTSFPTTYIVRAFYVFNNTLYVGTESHSIYTSTNGSTFTRNTSFSTNYSAVAFIVLNNTLYVGATNHGIYTSPNGLAYSSTTLSNISELLSIQLRSAAGPLGLKSAYIDNSSQLIVVSDGAPSQAIIEYTKTS